MGISPCIDHRQSAEIGNRPGTLNGHCESQVIPDPMLPGTKHEQPKVPKLSPNVPLGNRGR